MKRDEEAASPWREYDLTGVVFMRDRFPPRRNLTQLAKADPEGWRKEWARISRDDPALCALLKDPAWNALRTETQALFGAEVLIDS